MKKTKVLLCSFLLVLILGLSFQTRADMGPKPTSTVEIIGFDIGEFYYFDVLYEVSDRHFEILTDDELKQQIEYDYYLDDFPDVLNGYRDSDGFASYTLYESIPHNISQDDNNSNIYHLGYYSPPSTFKVCLVTESGKMIVSEQINKTMFDAYFIFDLTGFEMTDDQDTYLDAGTITENYPSVTGYIFSVIICVIITLAIELGILYLFKYRDKGSYKRVLIVNLITQTGLQIGLVLGYSFASLFGILGVLLLGELIVFITEMIAYPILLKERKRYISVIYALVANTGSILAGILAIFLIGNVL